MNLNNINFILTAGAAINVLSPISIFNTLAYPNQLFAKIMFFGNFINLNYPDNNLRQLITRANPFASCYFSLLAADSIILDPKDSLMARLPKIAAFIKEYFPKLAPTPEIPVPNAPILPPRYTGPIFNPFLPISGLNDASVILPPRYTGPIVNPFPTTSGLNDAPLIPLPSYNPVPNTSELAPLPQSSSLLPIIGAVAAIAVLGYLAYRLYPSRTIEPVKKEAEPIVVEPESPPKSEPELTIRNFSSTQFTKAAFFNVCRSIKYIALAILLIPTMVTQNGRLNFKSNYVRILPSLRETFISLTGIPCPTFANRLLNTIPQNL